MKKLIEVDSKLYLVPKGFLPKGRHKEIGNCYYCGLPIYASPGQAIKYVRIITRKGEKITYPTHKSCRHKAKNNKI